VKTEQLEGQVAALQTKLEQTEGANASTKVERQNLADQLQAARGELATQAQTANAKTEQLEGQVAALQADLKQAKGANTNTEAERQNLTDQLQAAREALTTQAQAADAKTEQLEGDITALQSSLQQAESANTSTEAEKQDLTTQLQAAREALTTQAQAANTKTGELEGEVAAGAVENKALNALLIEARTEVAAAREKASDLEATLRLQAIENAELYELLNAIYKDIDALDKMFKGQVEGLKVENRGLANQLQNKIDELEAVSKLARDQGELVGGLLTEMEAQKSAHEEASRKLNEAALDRVRNFEPQASEQQIRRFQELESAAPSTTNHTQMMEQMRIIRDQNAVLSTRVKQVEVYTRGLEKTSEATQIALAIEREAHESTRVDLRNKRTTRVIPGKHGLKKKLNKARPGRTIDAGGVLIA